jgi:hypothetical protein
MKKHAADSLFCQLKEKTYYRPTDLAKETGFPSTTVRNSLKELSKGGAVSEICDGNRKLYITNHRQLF